MPSGRPAARSPTSRRRTPARRGRGAGPGPRPAWGGAFASAQDSGARSEAARVLGRIAEVGFHNVTHLDLDAGCDRRIRPDRDGGGDHQARLTHELTTTTIPAALAAPRSASVSGRERTALLVLTALALLLRVTSLSRSLFTDEAYSLALAQRGFGHMFELFGYEANGTPYPIILWPLIRIFGTSEALLRVPAVIAGTASVPALWWAARRFIAPGGALLAAGLLAISPMAVWYSQMARPYAFVMLAAALAFGALPRALEGGGRRG